MKTYRQIGVKNTGNYTLYAKWTKEQSYMDIAYSNDFGTIMHYLAKEIEEDITDVFSYQLVLSGMPDIIILTHEV